MERNTFIIYEFQMYSALSVKLLNTSINWWCLVCLWLSVGGGGRWVLVGHGADSLLQPAIIRFSCKLPQHLLHSFPLSSINTKFRRNHCHDYINSIRLAFS